MAKDDDVYKGVRKVAYIWEACCNGKRKTVRAYTKQNARNILSQDVSNAEEWKFRKMGFPYPKDLSVR